MQHLYQVTETIEVSESKNIVIDLKGYILTRANSTLLNNKGTLEIKDSGQGEEGSKTYGKTRKYRRNSNNK